MPHPIAIDQVTARTLCDREHATVDVIRHTLHHELGRRTEARGPALFNPLEVAADAARRDDHRRRAIFEVAHHDARATFATRDRGWLEPRSAHAHHAACFHDQLIDALA